jgi:site-specific recombinase XerD
LVDELIARYLDEHAEKKSQRRHYRGYAKNLLAFFRLVQGGVDTYKVQRLLGHKSPMMTQRYAHHYPESLRDGVAILDQMAGVGTRVGHVVGSPVAVSV